MIRSSRFDRVRVILMFLCMAAFCFVITGAVTNAWSQVDHGGDKRTSGLWQICPGNCTFISLDNIPGWLFAVQCLFIVGKLLTILAFVGSIVLVMKPRIKIWYLSIAAILPAILLFIGLSLYKAMSMSHLEYSFYLAIVGVVILFIVFIISFMNYYQTLKHSKEGQPKPYIDLALENRLIVTSTSRDLIREEDSSLSRL